MSERPRSASERPVDDSGTVPASILVAEDDEIHRRALAFILRADGYDVRTVGSGEAAIEKALRRTPDLVVLDVDMPPEWMVSRRVVDFTSCAPPPPSVLFSQRPYGYRKCSPRADLGGLDYIGKPYDEADLMARVRAAIRLRREIDSLRSRATLDPLTGLMNRAELESRAAALTAMGERYRRPFGCLLIDVDHFKRGQR